MPWFKVDDGLAFHAKTVAAGNAAMGLWVRAGAWSAQQLFDGVVPGHIAALLGTPQQAARLVRVGLWHTTSDGFLFHEWDERNPKKEVIEEERAAARERMREIRARRKGTNPDKPVVSGTSSPEVLTTASEVFGNPDPTRPDPTTTSNDVVPTPIGVGGAQRQGGPKPKRGTRLPADFVPSEVARKTIIAESPDLDLRREHARFVDHWTAQPGQRGVKADWDATWRNWMRRSADELRRRGRTRQQETDDLFAAALARAEAADAAEAATIPGRIA